MNVDRYCIMYEYHDSVVGVVTVHTFYTLNTLFLSTHYNYGDLVTHVDVYRLFT